MNGYTFRDRREQCRNIINYLHGFTGDNFEKKMCEILRVYYQALGKSFEPVEAFRGDYKNDGWVKEDALFHGMFAPFTDEGEKSVQKSIEDKFTSDLKGLLENLNKGNWNGEISSFIFIVNMRDKNLPPNPQDFFNKKVVELQAEFEHTFSFDVKRPDDFLDDFHDTFSDKDITNVLMDLGIEFNKSQETIDEKDILSFIESITDEMLKDWEKSTKPEDFDGTRISPDKKIKINKLEEKGHEIRSILSKIYIVDNVVKQLTNRLENEKFERVRAKALQKHNELTTDTYDSVEVYTECVAHITEYAKNPNRAKRCAEYIIVYLFENCDLFEKVKDE